MFITGPEVIKTVLGEEISMEDLGGASVHAEITGNAHFFAESEIECFEQIKQLVSYIPGTTLKSRAFPYKAAQSKQYKIEEIFPMIQNNPMMFVILSRPFAMIRNFSKCMNDFARTL